METCRYIIEYLTILAVVILTVKCTNRLLLLYQQQHYHLSSLTSSFKYYYRYIYNLLMVAFIPIIFFCDLFYLQLIVIAVVIVYLVFAKQPKVLGLKFTNRILRHYIVVVITYTAINTCLFLLFPFKEIIGPMLVCLLLLPVYFAITCIICFPVEYLIYIVYQNKAKNRLKSIAFKTIAITGSYGKTTTKNILFSCLKDKYITYVTPRSYNTNNGIALSINQDITKTTEVAIFEYGASHKGDIDKLCKLAKPDIAIITAIGPQHIKTFKSMENIWQEKTKIITYAKKTYVNYEDYKKFDCDTANVITFGLSKKADWYITDTKYDGDKQYFKVKGPNVSLDIATSLLGSFQVYNILASVAVSYDLGVTKENIVSSIASMLPVEHRLEPKKIDGFDVIDDSFNSNLAGFLAALDVLKMKKAPLIVITPGIVEAGEMSEELNEKVAEKLININCFVVLIKCQSSMQILASFTKEFENYTVVASFKEALDYVRQHYQTGTILIENDIAEVYML